MPDFVTEIAAQEKADAAAAVDPVSYSYDPASRRNFIRECPVKRLFAVCHSTENPPDDDLYPTNHWTLTLAIGNNKGISLDVTHSDIELHPSGRPKAQVVVSELTTLLTDDLPQSCSITVIGERSVGWYINYLVECGCFKWTYHPSGARCGECLREALQLLVEIGQLDHTEANMAIEAIGDTWPNGNANSYLPGVYSW